MNKLLLLCIVLSSMTGGLYAQTKSISGNVISNDDGQTLPGVNIVVKGTTIGAITNADGSFNIDAPESAILVFSFVGYSTQEIVVGNQNNINVRLIPDTKSLNEVVVVGFGTEQKRDLTGNIASISGSSIQNVPVVSMEQSIQGKAAGVFIESGNGKVGQGIKVRVRGSSSVSAGNQPLYVVDGIPITTESQSTNGASTNPLADINFNDVESVEILKDASSGAIYGSRASNGVVLITTKRGKEGKTKININYFYGSSKETHRREFMNAQQYVDFTRQAGGKESRLKRYSAGNDEYKTAKVNTDWQDQVFRNAPVQQFDINLTGGNEKTKFYISAQYSDQNGILVGNRFQRLNGRINVDHKISEKLKIGLNFNLIKSINDRLSNDDAFSTPLQIVSLSPITPVIDPRTNLTSGALDPSTGDPNTNYPTYYNPLLNLIDASFKATVYRNISNFFGTYNILPGLNFRTEFGLDLLFQEENQYQGKLTQRNTGTANGIGKSTYNLISNYTTNNFFKYEKVFNTIHSFDIVAGMSFQESSNKGNNLTGQQFPSGNYKNLESAAQITSGGSTLTRFSLLSYFLRSNYKLNNKYLLSLSARIDGSSRFGVNNRYGFFPAASLGWIVSEESFLKNSTFLNFLKARVSYGLTGNSEIGNFPSRGLYTSANYVSFGGQAPLQLDNPNLKWETTTQADFGIDFGFFNNRINGGIDYYQKNTTDLLLNITLPGTSGFSTYTKNFGKLQNYGYEVVLNTKNIIGTFNWTTSFNISNGHNKITDLGGQQIQGNPAYINYAIEGQPIGVFYGKQFAGADPANGDPLYYIINADGTKTTTNDYNQATKTFLGSPNPKWIGGFTNTFSFNGIELSVLLQGVQGNKIFNGGGQYMSANGSNGYDNQTTDQLSAWKKPGDITNIPKAISFGSNGIENTDRYLSDGSYIRVKNVTLGYTLPKLFSNKIKFDRIRIYATA